jgi:hypothetical protein
LWPNLRHNPGIYLEAEEKLRKISASSAGLRVEIWARNQPEYEKGVLTTNGQIQWDQTQREFQE